MDTEADYKKVLCFGGWKFSNAPATSCLFRKDIAPANQETRVSSSQKTVVWMVLT
jgi:hypothetical protein